MAGGRQHLGRRMPETSHRRAETERARARSVEPAREWLPRKDLNLDKQDQNLLCYRYTTGHRKYLSGKNFHRRGTIGRTALVTPPGLEPGTNRTKTCCATDYTTGYRARQCSDASPVVYDFLPAADAARPRPGNPLADRRRAEGLRGNLAIERDQVHALCGRRAQLPEQRGDLPPMVAAVIDDVLQHLRVRDRRLLTIERPVGQMSGEPVRVQTLDERAHERIQPGPRRAHGGQVGEALDRRQTQRRAAGPALVPDLVGSVEMNQRSVHGAEAGAEVASVCLVGEPRDRIEHALASPPVVCDQPTSFFRSHASMFAA